jgi:hypothetical protein
MAYTYSAAKTWEGIIAGRRVFVYAITETGIADANSEWTLSTALVPVVGTITHIRVAATKGAGVATTIQPVIGSATGRTDVYSAGGTTAIASAATVVTDNRFSGITHALYGKTGANGTSDSAVTTLTIRAGHD